MKNLLLFFLIGMATLACDEEEKLNASVPCTNGVEATVRDLTGLDGCRFIFELEDGSRLEPLILGYCGTPPLSKEITEDPLFGFKWEDGKRVKIIYVEVPERNAVCMAGLQVKITCLEELGVESTRED